MGDEEAGQIAALLQIADHPHDLRPGQHIEHRARLIEDRHLRLHHERPDEGEALQLPAADLPGEAPQKVGREVEHGRKRQHGGPRRLDTAESMDRERLGHRALQPPTRVEGGFGMLGKTLHPAADRAVCLKGDPPSIGRGRPRRSRASVDLPHPLERVSRRVSPGVRVRSASATTVTSRLKSPPGVIRRLSARASGSAARSVGPRRRPASATAAPQRRRG